MNNCTAIKEISKMKWKIYRKIQTTKTDSRRNRKFGLELVIKIPDKDGFTGEFHQAFKK